MENEENGDINIIKNNDAQIKSPEDSCDTSLSNNTNESGVISELEVNDLIEKYGSLDKYLSIKLLEIAEMAVAPDNKGVLHIDYRTRLKTFETILKLKEKNFSQGNINVNFFSSPKQLKH